VNETNKSSNNGGSDFERDSCESDLENEMDEVAELKAGSHGKGSPDRSQTIKTSGTTDDDDMCGTSTSLNYTL
jgi:hypothetical protein